MQLSQFDQALPIYDLQMLPFMGRPVTIRETLVPESYSNKVGMSLMDLAAEPVPYYNEVSALIKNTPLIMFSQTGCKACVDAKELFRTLGIPYKEIDLKTAQYSKYGKAYIKFSTVVPGIYLGGQKIHTGNIKDWKNNGTLKQKLNAAGVRY